MTKTKTKTKVEEKEYSESKYRWHLCRYELNQYAWMGCKNPRNMAKKKDKPK